jgi:predicted RecA/RadA family phage recombinase
MAIFAGSIQSYFFAGNDQQRWDYVNPGPTQINSGDVIVLGGDPNRAFGNLIGCCTAPQGIDPGKLGSLATAGIFWLRMTDALVFNQGDPVYWDDTNNKATAGPQSASVFYAGLCSNAAAATDGYVRVDINRVGNVVYSEAESATTTTTTSTSTSTSTSTTVHP